MDRLENKVRRVIGSRITVGRLEKKNNQDLNNQQQAQLFQTRE